MSYLIIPREDPLLVGGTKAVMVVRAFCGFCTILVY